MRKITKETVTAFINKKPKTVGNTHTDGTALYLHGNLIAEWHGDTIYITDANWRTVTTKERLNGLLDMLRCHLRLSQLNYQWYIGPQAWTGSGYVSFENPFWCFKATPLHQRSLNAAI